MIRSECSAAGVPVGGNGSVCPCAGLWVLIALDGVWFEAPLHPVLTDAPIGAWTAALVFDGLDLATGKKPLRHAADASLAFGTLAAVGAAITGVSDWRYLSGGSRKMGGNPRR